MPLAPRPRAPGFVLAFAAFLIAAVTTASGQGLTPVGLIKAPADLVALDGSHAFVAAGRTLSIVDIADPADPAPRGRLELPDRIWALRVSPPLAFLALDLSGLAVVDISNVSAPVLRSVVKLPGQTVGVSSTGSRVLAANLMSGIEFIDMTDPDAPAMLGPFFTDGYARDVVIAGSLAFAVDQPTGFTVLDATADGPPDTPVGVDQSAEAPLMVAASADPIAGRRLAVVANGRGLLIIYDVTAPDAPRKVSVLKTPGRATRVAIQGSRAYVADGPAGVQIVNLETPAAALMGTWPTDGPARDVAAADGLVAVVSGPPGQGVVTLLR